MSDVLIEARNLGKKYCRSLSLGLRYGVSDITARLLSAREPVHALRPGEFWSVRDIDFTVRRGECLGLIGANGAGKSTLLKLISGIVPPSCGSVSVRGRVGSLIEVGAGFHPLLTGRENIYVNGAILGMHRRDIARQFDAIVEFAGVAEFLDMPVKHYSSGMYVRLGFAIAVHLEPDILLIDEVLAVGDAGFRAKCYNAIGRLRKSTAMIFVSHAMPMVSRLADRALLIERGTPSFLGATGIAIEKYNALFQSTTQPQRMGNGDAAILSLRCLNQWGQHVPSLTHGDPLVVEVHIQTTQCLEDIVLDLVFTNSSEDVIAECNNRIAYRSITLPANQHVTVMTKIAALTLNAGVYKLSALILSADMLTHHEWQKDIATLEVTAGMVGVAGQQFIADWTIEIKP